jgi:FKBP-type peptidyl-prolyl cis-trans isomerase (trigger factor)
MKVNLKKLPKNEVEVEAELEAEIFEAYFKGALQKIGQNVKLDGFRQGKVPEAVLLSHIPEISILEEMAQMALNEHYPKIVESEMLDVIGRPEISITKLARKNPLGFKIKTAVMPEIKLPDYKKIAKKVIGDVTEADKNPVVSEEDLENTIMDIRKSRAPREHVKEHVHKEGEEHKEDENLPEMNDEFVQALGPFKDVADFKAKLRENIKLEKQNQQKEKTRLKIVEGIVEKAEIDMPEILVESELEKILYRMESDITQMGLKFEDYLKHLNKTVEDLRKEFRKDAERKAKLGLVLNEIAKVEKIKADEQEVAKEVANILEHYKNADPERAKLHAENVLTNEKVFAFLENQ